MPDDEMMTLGFQQFVADRYEALLTLDLVKFKAYMRKYGEGNTIKGKSDEELLAAMHYARLNLDTLPAQEKEISKKYIEGRGWRLNPGWR